MPFRLLNAFRMLRALTRNLSAALPSKISQTPCQSLSRFLA